MHTHMIPVDVSNQPELTRLIADMRQSHMLRKLVQGKKIVAILLPVAESSVVRKHRATNYAAFCSAAGSWKDVDTEQLKKDILTARRQRNNRPPVVL